MNKCGRCCLIFGIVAASLTIVIVSVVIGVSIHHEQEWVRFTNFKAEIKQTSNYQSSEYHDMMIVQPNKHYTIDRVYPKVNEVIPSSKRVQGENEEQNKKAFDHEVTLGPFIIKKSFSKKAGVQCPSVCEPYAFGFKRNLTLCDYYEHTVMKDILFGQYQQRVWVESDTKYPVAVELYEWYDGSLFLKSGFDFCSFALGEEPRIGKGNMETVKHVSADKFSKRNEMTDEK